MATATSSRLDLEAAAASANAGAPAVAVRDSSTRVSVEPVLSFGAEHRSGLVVLADPPEAGWRLRTRSNEEATVDAELLAAPDYEVGREASSPERIKRTQRK